MSHQHKAARDFAIREARDLLELSALVILDTETTGLRSGSQAVEVGAVSGDGEVLLEQRIRPTVPVETGAARVHGIAGEDLAEAPSWPQIHERLLEFLVNLGSEGRLVIYNAEFDLRILRDTAAAHGLRHPVPDPVPVHCAMELVARFYGEVHSRSGGWRWQKLEKAARDLGVEPGGHSAAADARATLEVLRAIARRTPGD